jgi:Carboxypeptidase regulatory-like domain
MNRSRAWLPLICVCITVFMALIPPAYAQKTDGDIRGLVTDPSGAAVADAEVTARNTGTDLTRTVKSNSLGEFAITDLPIGTYTVLVKKSGFKEFRTKDVQLHVYDVAQVNAQLQVGNVAESVTVEANAIQVQTNTAALGETVDGEQIRELPLFGGNFVELTQLEPGVSGISGPGGTLNTEDKGILGGVDFSVNGNSSTANLFLLDGANNNDKGSNRTILIYPAIDSIAEFKMLRNSYGPEYGDAGGAVISIVTRSGTNDWHGTANYFGRNDALAAFEYFAKHSKGANGQPVKDELRRNDFGYTFGGPIKRDKLFFFWSEEWNKEIRGHTISTCSPTAAELQGDFTGSGPVTAADGCGPTPNFAALPPGFTVAGNPLKLAAPDPAGLLYAQLLPVANLTTPFQGDNYIQSVPSKIDWREESARVDFNVTKNNILTGRYTHDSWKNPAPHVVAYWGDNNNSPQLQGNWDQPSESIIGKLTSTIRSSLVNEVQFSYSHNEINTSAGGLTTSNGGAAGLVKAINAEIPTLYPSSIKQTGGVPIFWSGFQQYGGGATTWLISPYSNSMDTYTINDDITQVRGTHTLKAGFLWNFNKKNEDENGGYDQPAASMADWGLGPAGHPTGNGLANLLIPNQQFGGVNEFSTNPTDHARWHDIEFYVGDTWKARRNLTVEYGFRWSFLREPYELNNAMTSFSPADYDPKAPATDGCNGVIIVPGTNPCGAANALNGTNFSLGTPGPNRALRNNSNHAIAPRLGVSWDPWSNGKTAVRLGVGQFFQSPAVSSQVLLSANSPFSTNATVNRSLDPQNYSESLPSLSGVAAAPAYGVDPRAVLPNTWQWNFAIEQQLARNTTLEVGYVGNRGVHLVQKYDINEVAPANRLAAAFEPAGSAFNALRPLSNDGTIVYFARGDWSSYHALQVLFKSRVRDWVQLQAAYTWSHAIANTELDDSASGTGGGVVASLVTDLSNPRLDKGNTTINRPNIFVTNAIFYLPKLAQANSIERAVAGGWEFSTIATAESGNSITVYENAGSGTVDSISGTGYLANQRPNIVPGTACNSGSSGNQIINPNALTLVGFQIGDIGNEPRGYCHGPDKVNIDLSFAKNWNLTERFKLQFRFQGFNAFNHAQFRGDQLSTTYTPSFACGAAACSTSNSVIQSISNLSVNNPNFGQSLLTTGAREFQYGLKLTF